MNNSIGIAYSYAELTGKGEEYMVGPTGDVIAHLIDGSLVATVAQSGNADEPTLIAA